MLSVAVIKLMKMLVERKVVKPKEYLNIFWRMMEEHKRKTEKETQNTERKNWRWKS